MTLVKLALTVALFVGTGGAAIAAEFATKNEAVAMVNNAITFIKSEGPQKAYTEFTNKGGKFIDRDLYVVVYGMNGTVLAHGVNQKLVGKDMTEFQDIDGKFYIKERLALGASKPDFWQEYKFANPLSKKIEPKEMYCKRLDETLVCAGVYKA